MPQPYRAFAFLTGISFSLSVLASVIENVAGNVRAGATVPTSVQVRNGQRISTGSVYVTGPKSHAVLRFDDGQKILLGENSEFAVSEHQVSTDEVGRGKFVFDLRFYYVGKT